MTEQEYIGKQKVICRDEWFKNHRALKFVDDQSIFGISWAQPGRWTYGCHILMHSQWLTFVGDIGEAVYEWSVNVTPKFLVGIDFGYFHSKCRASENGSKFRYWNRRVASHELAEFRNRNQKLPRKIDAHISELTAETDEGDWQEQVRQAYYAGLEAELAADLSECGYVPHPRCIGHFVGLQMALVQLGYF